MQKETGLKTTLFSLALSFLCSLSFADVLTDPRDGNKYETYRFCSNNWMIQELKFLPQKPGCKSYPIDDKIKNGGQKYDVFSAKNCSLCPNGWHIPTELDVERLSKCEKERAVWDKANPTYNGSGHIKYYLDYNEEHSFGYFFMNDRGFGYDERGNRYPEAIRCVQDDNKKISFTEGTYTDKRDGKKYKTITVGGKTWFAQNLDFWTDDSFCAGKVKYGAYQDRTTILEEYPANEFVSHRLWGSPDCRKPFSKDYYDEEKVGEKKVKKKLGKLTIEKDEPVYKKVKKKYRYEPDLSDQIYGRYYSREEAVKVCPAGWHLSTRQDWFDLRESAGNIDLESPKFRYGSRDHIDFSALPLGYIGERVIGNGEAREPALERKLNSEYVIVRDYYTVFWRSLDGDIGPFVIGNAFDRGSNEQRLYAHIYENKKIFAPVQCVKND